MSAHRSMENRASAAVRRPIQDYPHVEAANELLGQVVRAESDRANRNKEPYSASVKMQSAVIHALLAVEERLADISNALRDV